MKKSPLFCLFVFLGVLHLFSQKQISNYEYWFDEDYTTKRAVTVSSSQTLDLSMTISTASLPVGLHSIQIRFQDNEGAWSATNSDLFIKKAFSKSSTIIAYEYWFDNQYEAKQLVSVSAKSFNLIDFITTSSLSKGLHNFHIRFKDSYGLWSGVQSSLFIKVTNKQVANKITAYRYWINSDSNMVTKKTDTINPLVLSNLIIPISQKAIVTPTSYTMKPNPFTGDTVIYKNSVLFRIQFKDLRGLWSAPTVDTVVYHAAVKLACDTLQSNVAVAKAMATVDTLHFYTMNALKGDSLAFNINIPSYTSNNPIIVDVWDFYGKKIQTDTLKSKISNVGFHAKLDGSYYIALRGFSQSIKGNYTITYTHIAKYAILGYNLKKVGNKGSSLFALDGNGFTPTTKLSLVLNGDTTLIPDTIVTLDYATLKSSISFDSVPIGLYDIVVDFGDTIIVVKNAVIIEQANAYAALSSQVIGNTRYLSGSSIQYTVKIINSSNISAHNIPVTIAIQCEDSTSIKKLKFQQKFSTIEDDSLKKMFNQDEEIIYLVKNYLESDNDLRMFYLIKDSLGHYFLRCELLIPEIAPNSSIDFPFTIYENRSKIDISAAVPEKWIDGISSVDDNSTLKSGQLRSSGHHLCCDDWQCLINFALSFVPGIDVEGFSALSNCAIDTYIKTFHVSVLEQLGCAEGNLDKKNARKQAEKMAQSVIKDIMVSVMNCWFDHLFEKYGKEVAKKMLTDYLAKHSNYFLGVALNIAETGTDCYISHLNGKGWGKCGGDEDNHHLPSSPVTSFDPNDKYGFRSPSGSNYFSEDKANFTYVINFENIADATAPAHEVVITDTLDATKFDIKSFRAGYIKIGSKMAQATYNAQSMEWDVDMRPNLYLRTNVKLDYDSISGIAKWHLKTIDPQTDTLPTDPLVGFLPPNDSIGSGQGSVSFSINLIDSLANGASVANKASIVFDYNEPIVTPTWINTKDMIAPTSSMLQPVIVTDSTATLIWQAEDNKNGSGVYLYNVYVKNPKDTIYSELLSNTSLTSLEFKYKKDRDYAFYVTAIDSAANTEEKTAVPDVTLRVATGIENVVSGQSILMKVLPNPSKEGVGVFVSFSVQDETLLQDAQLLISTLNGSLLKVIAVTSKKLEVKNLASGVYVFSLQYANKTITSEKVIIQ